MPLRQKILSLDSTGLFLGDPLRRPCDNSMPLIAQLASCREELERISGR